MLGTAKVVVESERAAEEDQGKGVGEGGEGDRERGIEGGKGRMEGGGKKRGM